MIILDTNVLSELIRQEPDPAVVRWLDLQPSSSIWTTSITLMEMRSGLLYLPAGKRKIQITKEVEAMLREEIEERYAVFDTDAAEESAKLMAARKLNGRPVELRDTMLAGIVLSRRAILATRNASHFSDLGSSIVNPWNA
jgi:toxin FitB